MADNTTRIVISAVDQASAALTSIRKSVGDLDSGLGGLGATLASTLSVGGMAALVKASVDAADSMQDLSQRIGIGVKELAAWQLAANQSGTSIEAVAKGVKGLSGYMVEHRKELAAAGITATDANGALLQLADLFKAMPDGIEKTALATKLMGKAGMDMIPVLNMGSAGLEAARAKAQAYAEQLARLAPQADEFNDMMAELSLNSKAAGMNITAYFLPGLIGMSQWLNDIAKGGKSAWNAVAWIVGGLPEGVTLKGNPASVPAAIRSTAADLAAFDAATATYMAEREAMKKARGLLGADGGGKAKKPGSILGPDDILYDIQEAVRKSNRAAIIKEQADAEKALADIRAAADKALVEHTKHLGDQVAAAERALETYGLTESQIADLTLARLQHAKAMEAEQDADEATLAWYDREIEALQKIRAAKFAVEARDTAKKEAEDAAKAWQDFARDLESSLTDALMRSFEAGDDFGQAFADNLKNLFKTMILKAAVQISVGTVAGAASQALGINLGGSGGSSGGIGGALNLLSNGSSIYSAATGGGLIGGFGLGAASAASELALGASFVGPSASLAGGAIGAGATAGLATGSASAAGAMSSIAAAAPYIAGALAIASIFGGFGKNKPAPIEWGLVDYHKNTMPGGVWDQYTEKGPFTNVLAIGQHLTRNGQTRAGLQAQIASPAVQLDRVLAQYLNEAETKKVAKALFTGNEGEHAWGEQDAVMMRRLNRISNAIGGWADKAFDTTTGNLQKRYSELAQILSLRGNEMVEKLAKDMLNATGKWDYQKFAGLQAARKAFDDSFKTDADRFQDYSDAMHKAFEKLNLTLPDSRDAFKDMVEAVDTSTKSGFELYVTLLDLAPTMDAYYQALKDEAAIKGQLSAMNASHFATAADFRRYQAVSTNFDGQFAGDYAYNIRMGAITPGAAANGDLVSEIRALRSENQAQSVALALANQETARILRRWNGDGMPETRVVA